MRDLKVLPIFAGLSADQIDAVTKSLPRKVFRKHETIIEQGEKGRSAYLLLEGKVEVYCESKEGQRVTVIYHEAPFIFGELEIWDGRKCLASVRAIERSETLVLDRSAFLKLVHSHHQVAVNLAKLVSDLLYKTGEDRRVKFFGRVEHLLANTLCSFAKMYGIEHRYGVLIQQDVTNTELAEILGVARKSVIEGVAKLQKENLIQKDGNKFIIPDLAALRRKAMP